MLNDSEWNTINNILLELYTIDDVSLLFQKVMRVFRMLIPYTQGYFVLLDERHKIKPENIYFVDMDDTVIKKYMEQYYDMDYLKYLYEFATDTTVYKDTEILEDTIRTQTEFYRKFLKPANIPYGCGILLVKEHRILAVMNLFRSESLGDFSEKDMYILNVLKRHLENMVFKAVQGERQQELSEECYAKAAETYELTKRETEILPLLCKGLSNNEICDTLSVSLSTVKKHVYNLYAKTAVSSRTQLVNLIYTTADF